MGVQSKGTSRGGASHADAKAQTERKKTSAAERQRVSLNNQFEDFRKNGHLHSRSQLMKIEQELVEKTSALVSGDDFKTVYGKKISKMVRDGHSPTGIAQTLNLSVSVVRNYINQHAIKKIYAPRYLDFLMCMDSEARLKAMCLPWSRKAKFSKALRDYYVLKYKNRLTPIERLEPTGQSLLNSSLIE